MRGAAALLVIVRHRGRWARVLPRFAQMSLICVAVLLAGGVVGAVIVLDSPSQLYATGYGRVLSAKIALAAALGVLAWFNRSRLATGRAFSPGNRGGVAQTFRDGGRGHGRRADDGRCSGHDGLASPPKTRLA